MDDDWTPLTDDPADWPLEGKPVLIELCGFMAVDRWHMIDGQRQWANHLNACYWMPLPDRPNGAQIFRNRQRAAETERRFRETMARNTSGTIQFRRPSPWEEIAAKCAQKPIIGDHHDSEKG